jgi:pilus assembly protein CpaE
MSTAAVKLSGESHSEAQHDLAVMAFVADDVTRQTLIRLAAEQKWRDPVIQTGGIAAARQELGESTSPTLLIVDLSESSEPLADINGLADVCEPGTRVIALGTTNDVRLYRSLMDAGVTDYMVKPVAAADFTRAMAHAMSSGKQDGAEGKHSRIHTVVGARGGVGASTVALNLAWILSQEQKQRVVLIDLDLHFGTVGLSLDIDPGNGFRDVLHNPGRIDPLFLERAAIRVNDTLAILSTEEPLSGAAQWSPEAFIPMLAELGKMFDHIILDVPRAFAVQHPELISAATTTLLVTDLSLSAMRDALRIKTLVRETAPQTRLKVVLNQYRPLGKSDMPAAEFERSIDEKIACNIPFDPKSVAQAASAGKPMAAVAKKSKGAEALRKMSQGLLAAKAGKKRGSVLGRLFKS